MNLEIYVIEANTRATLSFKYLPEKPFHSVPYGLARPETERMFFSAKWKLRFWRDLSSGQLYSFNPLKKALLAKCFFKWCAPKSLCRKQRTSSPNYPLKKHSLRSAFLNGAPQNLFVENNVQVRQFTH